ncbi:52 kDa repressor of the inhibitor of the protein kinase [Biomphalaria glabrata]|nr:52 kDa repressor of the inhibitor of the protein kinase-like [Biomphalaria glabrata]
MEEKQKRKRDNKSVYMNYWKRWCGQETTTKGSSVDEPSSSLQSTTVTTNEVLTTISPSTSESTSVISTTESASDLKITTNEVLTTISPSTSESTSVISTTESASDLKITTNEVLTTISPSTSESTSVISTTELASDLKTESISSPGMSRLDVGFYWNKDINDSLKVQILKEPWVPSKDYKFPVSTKRNLRFQLNWLSRFPWISYSEYKSGAFCRICVIMGRSLEGKGTHQRLGQLVSEPFRKWKNALEIFQAHAQSEYHKRNS